MADHVGAAIEIVFHRLHPSTRIRGARHQNVIARSRSFALEPPESPRIFSRLAVESGFAPRPAAIAANFHFGNDSFRSPGGAFN